MNYRLKYKQRTAQSLFKPTIYIILELILLSLIIYVVIEINSTLFTVVSIFGAIYYFVTSSIPKFTRVIKRQEINQHLNTFDIVTQQDKY